MTITKNDTLHLANLSSISIDSKESASLAIDLEKIVKYIEQLSELNTDGIEPTYQVTGLSNIQRNDQITPQVDRETLLALAPEQAEHQVRVPKVL